MTAEERAARLERVRDRAETVAHVFFVIWLVAIMSASAVWLWGVAT